MIPFWKNPRTDLSPLGDETVARIRILRNSPPHKKSGTDAPAASPFSPNLPDPGRGCFVPAATRTNP